MEWLKRILSKKESTNDSNQDKRIDVYHDYGTSLLEYVLKSGDFEERIRGSQKKYILTNVEECKNKVSIFGLVTSWKGTGHMEWEYLLAAYFADTLMEALNKHQEEADITCLFDKDLMSKDGSKVFKQEDIYAHLIDWFNVESETDYEVRVSLKFK